MLFGSKSNSKGGVYIKSNKIYLTIIVLLLITLVSFVFFGVRYRNNQINEVVILEGENENWKLEEYKILIFNNYVRLGDGEVIFIGDKEKVKDLKSFEIEIVKIKKNNSEKEMTLYNWSMNSNEGFTIADNIMAIGDSTTYNGIRKYIPRAYETNISKHDNFNFSKEYTVKLKIKVQKVNGEKIDDEIILNALRVTKDTISNVSMKTHSK